MNKHDNETCEDVNHRLHAMSKVFMDAPDPIVIQDMEGRIIDANAAAVRLYGWPREQLVGANAHLLEPPEQRDTVEALLERCAGSSPVRNVESVQVTKDGAPFPVLLTLSLITNAKDQPIGVVSLAKDVSRLRAMEKQVRAWQRMEAVGRFASGVAHDYNNVLTIILTCADFLHDEPALSGTARDDIGTIRKAAERARRLTRQLLALSRRESQELVVVNINDLVVDIEHMLRRLVGEDVDLRVRLAHGLGTARVDPTQIERVLMNLTANACDAMPDGGTLTIETANVALEAATVSFMSAHVAAGDYVMLALSDNGVGMDEATQAQIFEPFFTTKTPDKGTGLGLPTVFGIVEQSRGVIDVSSEVGGGTTVKVYLPRARDALDDSLSAPTSAVHLRGSETNLDVEDDNDLRRDGAVAADPRLPRARGENPAHAVVLGALHRGDT